MLLDKLMLNKNIGTVSKTGVGATLPGVQIPLSPPIIQQNQSLTKRF